ncbi:Hypothetical predicted protein, partial [Mytilus galloprovincialis]
MLFSFFLLLTCTQLCLGTSPREYDDDEDDYTPPVYKPSPSRYRPENACKPNTCRNGGNGSADKFGDYTCDCRSGYYGPECESKE